MFEQRTERRGVCLHVNRLRFNYPSIDDVVASLTARPPNPLPISVCLLPDLIESTFTVAHSLKIRHSQNGRTLAVGN